MNNEWPPIDITGEVIPLPKEVSWQQKLVNDGYAYWEDGEIMMKLPYYGLLMSGFNETAD